MIRLAITSTPNSTESLYSRYSQRYSHFIGKNVPSSSIFMLSYQLDTARVLPIFWEICMGEVQLHKSEKPRLSQGKARSLSFFSPGFTGGSYLFSGGNLSDTWKIWIDQELRNSDSRTIRGNINSKAIAQIFSDNSFLFRL